jgi:hypothetical protein
MCDPKQGVALLVLLTLSGYHASNVVARSERAIDDEPEPTQWRVAEPADVAGLWESMSIRGESAFALRFVCYWFAADGTWSGAALVESDNGMAFQSSGGRWRLGATGLLLDDSAPSRCEASASDYLRVSSGHDVVILRRRPAR